MQLHDVIATMPDEVMRGWEARVQGKIAPGSIARTELRDHLPAFLTEIVSALREDAGLPATGPSPAESETAAEHGENRLRLGFSLDAVVREYGALRDSIVAAAVKARVEMTLRELEVLSNATIAGIARAVTEYARQRDAELRRLANEHYAFVAHELRNPLTSAMTAFALLKSRGVISSEGRTEQALERALSSATKLVDQSLRTARIASGVELHRQATTLRELLAEAEAGVSVEADAKGVALQLAVEGDGTPVYLDPSIVASALSNLIRNGVKYSLPRTVVEVRAHVATGHVVVEVEDCCGGLPPGKVEEAFAPFARLDQRESGFGLGLAIAKQAADAHGGSIRVQNLPGKGCMFVLELPLAAPATNKGSPDRKG